MVPSQTVLTVEPDRGTVVPDKKKLIFTGDDM